MDQVISRSTHTGHCKRGLMLLVVAISLAGCDVQSAQDVSGQPASHSAITSQLPLLDTSTDVEGPDENGNYLRDDIEHYIATLDVTPRQRGALRQLGSTIQRSLLVDKNNQQGVYEVAKLVMRSFLCMSDTFQSDKAKEASLIESLITNTPERQQAYQDFLSASDNMPLDFPQSDPCDK